VLKTLFTVVLIFVGFIDLPNFINHINLNNTKKQSYENKKITLITALCIAKLGCPFLK